MARDNETKALEENLTTLGWLELGTKFCAGMLALTYVSGYLIATTYLGTYNIYTGANESFRAKFIYIGSFYCVFIVAFGIATYTVSKILDLFTKHGMTPDISEINLAKDEWGRRNDSKHWKDKWPELRWRFMVVLILVVFSLQILFFNPESIRIFAPFQAIFLGAVALYQVSYFRELSRENYSWGLIEGRTWVEWVRNVTLAVDIIIAGAMVMLALRENRRLKPMYACIAKFVLDHQRGYLAVYWSIGVAIIAVAGFIAFSLTLSSTNISHVSKVKFREIMFGPNRLQAVKRMLALTKPLLAAPGSSGTEITWKGKCKEFGRKSFDSVILCVLTSSFLWVALKAIERDDSRLWAKILGYGTLLLALTILSNMIILIAMGSKRKDLLASQYFEGKHVLLTQFEPKREITAPTLAEKLDLWAFRAIPAGILYIVSVLGFAYLVYPLIPQQKSGGDYSTADKIKIVLMEQTSAGSCPKIPDLADKPLIMLDENSVWVYLARYDDAGQPTCWRWGAFCHEVPDEAYPPRPSVYAINQSCVARIEPWCSGDSKNCSKDGSGTNATQPSLISGSIDSLSLPSSINRSSVTERKPTSSHPGRR